MPLRSQSSIILLPRMLDILPGEQQLSISSLSCNEVIFKHNNTIRIGDRQVERRQPSPPRARFRLMMHDGNGGWIGRGRGRNVGDDGRFLIRATHLFLRRRVIASVGGTGFSRRSFFGSSRRWRCSSWCSSCCSTGEPSSA